MSNIKPDFSMKHMPDPNTWVFPEKSIWRRRAAPSHFVDAERRQVIEYYRCETLEDILRSISEGYPVIFGFDVFNSFYGRSGPLFNVPDPMTSDYYIGGHAVIAHTYDTPSRRVVARNSWGDTPHEGKPDFTLSYNYIAKFASDAWTCRMIEGARPAKQA
jgi:C1A family cysteine protease